MFDDDLDRQCSHLCDRLNNRGQFRRKQPAETDIVKTDNLYASSSTAFASSFGLKPVSSIAATTLGLLSSSTFAVPFITLDTVEGETPAILVTSLMLAKSRFSRIYTRQHTGQTTKLFPKKPG